MRLLTGMILFCVTFPLAAESGRVVGASGSVIIQRGEQGRPAQAGEGLLAGDVVTTGEDASLMFLTTGPVASVYVGGSATLGVVANEQETEVSIQLEAGELRVSPMSGRTLAIISESARIECPGDSTVCVRSRNGETRVKVEAGLCRIERLGRQTALIQSVDFQTEAADVQTVNPGESIVIHANGDSSSPLFSSTEHWEIQPANAAFSTFVPPPRKLRRLQKSDRSAETVAILPRSNSASAFARQGAVANDEGIQLTIGERAATLTQRGSGSTFAENTEATTSGQLVTGIGNVMTDDPFPGNIHLITGESSYAFTDLSITPADAFPTGPEYWSIGLGDVPVGQVITNLSTASAVNPTTLHIPGFDAYLIRLDQFNQVDPATIDSTPTQAINATGLTGESPATPTITGVTPLVDDRADINGNMTFALGEFTVQMNGDTPVIAMRRSDQDRTIIKDGGNDDTQDVVEVNRDVAGFATIVDAQFVTPNDPVYVPLPDSLRFLPRYDNSNQLRKAAFTVLTADRLHDIARRTGQTRFVVDGQIVDITGYKP